MVWNTIAHPRMMNAPAGAGSASLIKFADAHKLSFYDIIASITGTIDDRQYILVKGDFETLKRMILNNEAVCGAMFTSSAADDGSFIRQDRGDVVAVNYLAVTNVIALMTAVANNTRTLYLHSDNTITNSLVAP